jgi:hypothetical protein
MSIVPNFKWAQNKEVVFVTVEVTDPSNVKVVIKDQALSFACKDPHNKSYSFDAEFSKAVDASGSKYAARPRGVEIVLKKTAEDTEFWGHLLKKPAQWKTHCHVDWSKWVEEDEEVEDANADWRNQIAGFNPVDFPDDLPAGDEGDEEEDEEEEEETTQ